VLSEIGVIARSVSIQAHIMKGSPADPFDIPDHPSSFGVASVFF
jgi:hypothetical protein